MSFLTAEWRKLCMINYEVDTSILKDYLPYDTELDLWEGKCYVSLIGFMFLNTKLLGFKLPYHSDFEEVNLRFYVKRLVNNEWRRGVVFIKEIVPKPALSFVANLIYNENYVTRPMQHVWKENKATCEVAYKWRSRSGWQSFNIMAEKNLAEIIPGSEAEFITEHYWGYAKVNAKKTNEYAVFHPRWFQYKVISHDIAVDFEETYGPKFGFLTMQEPTSVILAEGSEIKVEKKVMIK